jgi:DNA (cytosine-5)-methyltransferase 1
MRRLKSSASSANAVAIDLFCGAGGLTRGLLDAGIPVVAGYDIDSECKYAYESNNVPAKFHATSVTELDGESLSSHFGKGSVRILVGCAPCQTFSKYTQGRANSIDPKWGLLAEFSRIVEELQPDLVSIENVPELQRHQPYFDFLLMLKREKYFVSAESRRVVYCPDYGIPQHRRRLVLLASKLGPIELIPATHLGRNPTVRDALGNLPRLKAGQVCKTDPMHRCSQLSSINLERMKHSRPGGTWRDWPQHLIAECHQREKGATYPSVYGRMEWDKPAPTITTQFFGFGNGRFGHPAQDRAISLKEGAILQSFPLGYRFVEPGRDYIFSKVGKMIGNAVPVRLGEVVGLSIKDHLSKHTI